MLSQVIVRLHGGLHSGLTAYFSILFLVFFLPASLVGYAVCPNKYKKYALILFSLAFYWLVCGELVVYLLGSSAAMWFFGRWLMYTNTAQAAALKTCPKEQKKELKQRFRRTRGCILAAAVVLHIGLLLTLKYSGFFIDNVNALLGLTLPAPHFLKPLGISFFTLEAVSYLVDVSRGTLEAETSYPNLLLFLSFFPKIVEGPICRYGELRGQFAALRGISWDKLRSGVLRILYGLMKKMVVADRLNMLVSQVFSDPDAFPGVALLFGAVCYTAELYMDFSGSMDAVCGIGEIFGLRMPENFRRPFFSKTVSEFWTRWHITLGAWFRDYVFYPIGLSSGMKQTGSALRRKYGNTAAALFSGAVSLLCVWFCNGLWHGAAWNYVFFGLYHFAVIFIGTALAPWNPAIFRKLHIDSNSLWYRTMQHIRTCFLVVIGELFFRVSSVAVGFQMLQRIFTEFGTSGCSGWLQQTGLDPQDIGIAAFTCGIVLVISLLQEKGINVREKIQSQRLGIRWMIWLALILFIIIFGAYGGKFVPVDPMYADF